MHAHTDSGWNLPTQAGTSPATPNGISTLSVVSATRDGRGTRDVPLEMRQAVARAIEGAIKERFAGKSERVIAKSLGVSQPALNKLRHADGALGVNALLELRRSLRISIDDLLGLPALAPAQLTAAELDELRSVIRDRHKEPHEDPAVDAPAPRRRLLK
jgi:transcriptional regulator with XRE-family HTH domain